MAKNLVIVESPAKAKTIEKYLGKDFTVTSSKGHIRDLTTRGYGGFGVDIENQFKPMYKNLKDKSAIVKELKKEVKNTDTVYLATDPDREGEAISWHLFEVLGLEQKKYERIVFHEITKQAVLKAIEHGRDIDLNLVRSQESRRILDRIIGFSLSKLLQKKIGSKSAGRVQSVALKIIVDREREIESFVKEEYWEIFCEFSKKNQELKAKLIDYNGEKIKLSNDDEASNVIHNLTDEYKIVDIIYKRRDKNPKPPFITSSLQQEASSKFNFNAKKTMMIAQKLYEGIELKNERVGLITYMRTDSFRLSNEFVEEASAFIQNTFGKEYGKPYVDPSKKGKNVQDAHEAIRPSKISYSPEFVKDYLSKDEYKLYSLIYARAVSSLMKPAVMEDEKLRIENNGYGFEISGERVVFDGYLKMYSLYDSSDIKQLPKFEKNEVLKKAKATKEQKFTNPPYRYSEARLIRKLEELGIGRPSTYSMIVETLKQRNYVKLENKAFIPTKQGILTSDKLQEYFNSIINIQYTAQMEDILDDISEGDKVWFEELENFYNRFKPLVEFASETMEKIYPKYLEELCPKCQSKLVIRNGRFGEFVACSSFPKCRYIKKEEDLEKLTDIACPSCKEGLLIERVSKRGRSKGNAFYACNRYPNCETTFSSLPTEEELKNYTPPVKKTKRRTK